MIIVKYSVGKTVKIEKFKSKRSASNHIKWIERSGIGKLIEIKEIAWMILYLIPKGVRVKVVGKNGIENKKMKKAILFEGIDSVAFDPINKIGIKNKETKKWISEGWYGFYLNKGKYTLLLVRMKDVIIKAQKDVYK